MGWRDFKSLTPIDNIDKRDKSPQLESQAPPFVPIVAFVDKGMSPENESNTSLLDWYLSVRHTFNLAEDLFGYRNSKLSEPVELINLILKEPLDYWMRTNGDLEHCLGIIMRHVEAGHA